MEFPLPTFCLKRPVSAFAEANEVGGKENSHQNHQASFDHYKFVDHRRNLDRDCLHRR